MAETPKKYTKNIMRKKALILFAKYPIRGKVKTRLEQGTGAEFALDFYKACAMYIFDIAAELNDELDVWLFYSYEDDESAVKKWVGKNFFYEPQVRGNLGAKISGAFNLMLGKGYDKALIIGTDIPDISMDLLKRAFETLDKKDVVIGPCADGGYYLLALRAAMPFLFDDIEWSGENVLRDTVSKLKMRRIDFELLDELIDVDDLFSLKKWLSFGANTTLKNQLNITELNED